MFSSAEAVADTMAVLSLKKEIAAPDDETDNDTVNEETLSTLFEKGELLAEKLISTNSYVLHLDGTNETQPTLAAAESNNSVHILKFENGQICEDAVLKEHKELIVGVKFSTDNQQTLFTASNDGVIKLWDLRTPKKAVLNFIDTSREEGKEAKPFTSFSVSPNNRLVVAGTALYLTDAFLLFWDARNAKFLGGYWESHTDDITELKFHPDDSNTLISGSTDGLINLYDLSEQSEENALRETFNTESSVDTLTWYKIGETDAVACVTHTNDLQLRNVEDAEPYANFGKKHISTAMKRSSEAHTYIARTHAYNSSLLVLAGSTYGDGECVRTLLLKNKTLQPAFSLNDNKQVVRSSWCNQNTQLLATGGENGVVNMWKMETKR